MARFRGTIQGQRGEASRLGGERSGLIVQANGWHVGVAVEMGVDANDNDIIDIELNAGSAGDGGRISLGRFTRADLEKLCRKRDRATTRAIDCLTNPTDEAGA